MRAAVFVDAGYLFAQGSLLLTGARQGRELLSLDIPAVTAALKDQMANCARAPLLRIYCYDAILLLRCNATRTANTRAVRPSRLKRHQNAAWSDQLRRGTERRRCLDRH